jgi:hypothetical protein
MVTGSVHFEVRTEFLKTSFALKELKNSSKELCLVSAQHKHIWVILVASIIFYMQPASYCRWESLKLIVAPLTAWKLQN